MASQTPHREKSSPPILDTSNRDEMALAPTYGEALPRHCCTCFGSTYTKIGTIQRRLAWPLRKDDTQIREAFHIFCLISFRNGEEPPTGSHSLFHTTQTIDSDFYGLKATLAQKASNRPQKKNFSIFKHQCVRSPHLPTAPAEKGHSKLSLSTTAIPR